MHYYQFNIADYRKDTSHLVPIEHYIYRSLIDTYYLDEKPIGGDVDKLCRRLSLDPSYSVNITNVLKDFFVKKDSKWSHKRINVDIHGYKENIVARNRANGKLGGRPKKTQWVASGNPEVTQINPNYKPITNKPITNNQVDQDTCANARFDDFWKAYPIKRDKKKAKAAWLRKKLNGKSDLVINDVINRQQNDSQWMKGFIPLPTTYINGERWDDEIDTKQQLVSTTTMQNVINTKGWADE